MRNPAPINHFPPTLFSPNRSPIYGEAHLFSPQCLRRRTWATRVVVAQLQGRVKGAALRRPKKPRPAVARRICPRRPGVEWQESMWNRLKSGNANDKRRQSLSASRSCRPMERSANGHRPVLPSCARGIRCVLKMHWGSSRSGSVRTEPALKRLELCEGKLSRTVLRGVWAG